MWSVIFIASLAQGIFFLLLLLISKKYRTNASRYLCLLLALFLLTNVDYYFIASEHYKVFPWLFGISNGLILLMGPILYLYTKTLLLGSAYCKKDLLHFIPYAMFLGISFPLFTLSAKERIFFIDVFASGNLPLRAIDYAIFIIQLLHLGVYLLSITRIFKSNRLDTAPGNISWVRSLVIFLKGYCVLVLLLVVAVFSIGRFSLIANYSYALACSVLLYFVTGFALLNPNVSFEIKRKSKKTLDNVDADAYWKKVILLMENDKMYVNPEIRLQDVAGKAELTPHQLSQLINERSGKTFSDFINYYRVEEFKRRIVEPGSDQFTLVGLALEIGFNSKTTFNNTFKKFTGSTPSEYKRNLR